MIMATGAPFAGPGAHHRLHVFDRFPVELVVEGSKVMGGAFPLLIDIAMAFAALLRFHEERRWNQLAVGSVGAGGKEGTLRTCAFFVHGYRDGWRIEDLVARMRNPIAIDGARGEHGGRSGYRNSGERQIFATDENGGRSKQRK